MTARKADLMKKDDKLSSYQAKQELIKGRKAISSKDNRIALLAAASALVIAFAGQALYFNVGPGSTSAGETANDESPESTSEYSLPSPEVAEARLWNSTLELNGSPVNLELDGVNAPQAVANFVSLTQAGYFEGITCHRLVTEGIYVLQCGDPSGDGTGGPGYNFGPIENAPEADLYTEGVLAMARRGGDGNSMGSQFFIVYQDSVIPSDQAGGYTVFGRVTGGMDIIKSIAAQGTEDGSTDGRPASEVKLGNVSVE
jgi:peptidyl-prolyl cis-trans isomerase B (cyclophilin B)